MRQYWNLTLLFLFVLTLITSSFSDNNTVTPYKFPKLNHFPKMPVSSKNPVTVEGVELGRHLFYDTILSKDKSISCASCHKQKYAFSDSPEKFSKGIYNQSLTRNTMPLFNLAWYSSFHWDGVAKSIEEQVSLPIKAHNELNMNWEEIVKRIKKKSYYNKKFKEAFGDKAIDSTLISYAIAQFERTLISFNSKFDQVIRGEAILSKDEYDGFELINNQTKGGCLHCHTTDADVLGTTGKFSNNGLDAVINPNNYSDKGRGLVTGKTEDFGLFKIPSLRNIAITAPYMHDGRFSTLEEVLEFYSSSVNNSINIDSKMEFAHQGGNRLTQDENRKIIVFLQTLTDSVFITNPRFSNPFENLK